ncbi:spermidine/putrescine ABC transporter permease [Corynebacterium sp. FDAARGOS 1242]|uniref:ABC transporter permease n=1 Tax=Corynebacterium sp. FDAARGOS 1242 TaxID=2778078 RepID=UPI001950CF03|nr:spermidine/putrescine ABC transporter permease [Corynebacterium sp. FDAARGOS 1242]QRP97157.1 spermidine/putrescine ABC transporter permease [Corynebacterium sp. FDAARGOS 1242]
MTAKTDTAHAAPVGKAKKASTSKAAWATMLPLGIILTLFFVVPIVGMAITSLQSGSDGSWTMENYQAMTQGNRLRAMWNSVLVSLISSLVALVIGLIVAWCITHIKSQTLDSVTAVVSSVLSNSGGAPLAFSFIVLAGNTGYLISLLVAVDKGFSLYSIKGLVLMYQYFLIPTVVLLILPSIKAMRAAWKEANTSLGGSALTFWKRVGLPILAPTILGVWILEFGAAFATHASAAVLIGTGTFPLIVLQIAAEMGASATSGGEHIAMAMGLTTTVIAIITLVAFNALQKRSARWLK